jgi:hypothetical protein
MRREVEFDWRRIGSRFASGSGRRNDGVHDVSFLIMGRCIVATDSAVRHAFGFV